MHLEVMVVDESRQLEVVVEDRLLEAEHGQPVGAEYGHLVGAEDGHLVVGDGYLEQSLHLEIDRNLWNLDLAEAVYRRRSEPPLLPRDCLPRRCCLLRTAGGPGR